MKTIKLFIRLIAFVLLKSCEPKVRMKPKVKFYTLTVVGKKEAVESHSEYKLNMWSGKLVLVPEVETVYYLIYSDHTHEAVSLDTYTFTNIGDKIQKSETSY